MHSDRPNWRLGDGQSVHVLLSGRRDWRYASAPQNPGGSPEATRRAFNKRFLLDLAEDWQQHGREVFKRVRRESPAAYLKVCAMLVPREMQIEHSGGVKAMSDEALENAIEALERMLGAKVIEGVAEPVPDLPPPSRKPRRKRGAGAKASLLFPDEQGESEQSESAG